MKTSYCQALILLIIGHVLGITTCYNMGAPCCLHRKQSRRISIGMQGNERWEVNHNGKNSEVDAGMEGTAFKDGDLSQDAYYSRNKMEYRLRTLSNKKALESARILQALQIYKDQFADNLTLPFTISITFVIPANDDNWPSALWGMKLGMKVYSIQNGNTFAYCRDKFREIGLDLSNSHESVKQKSAKLLNALKVYKCQHVNENATVFSVPQTFVVPKDDANWPKTLWGYKLGVVVKNIQYRFSNRYVSLHDELKALGLNPTTSRKNRNSADVLLALQIFKKLYIKESHSGSFTVPVNYEVPTNDLRWPKTLWGTRLGGIAVSIRRNNSHSDYREQFRELGLRMK